MNNSNENELFNQEKHGEHVYIQRPPLICPNNVPPIHGRPNPIILPARQRLSNHQRNLSLDFRYSFF